MKDKAKLEKKLNKELREISVALRKPETSSISFAENLEGELFKESRLVDRVLRYVPDLVFCKNKEGAYLDCNPAFSELAGLSVKEVIGKTDSDLFEKETADFFRMNDNKVLERNCSFKNDEWVTYPDGRRVFLEIQKSPLKVSDRENVGILGICRDITDRKHTESTLKNLKHELIKTVHVSLIPMFVIAKDHTVLYWNEACENITGIPATEIVDSKDLWKVFYREKRPLLSDLIVDDQTELIQSYYGQIKIDSSSKESAYEVQDYLPTIDKWLLFSAAPLKDKSGTIIGAMEILQDITTGKKAEEELLKQHDQLLSIFEGIDEPAYVSDPDSYELLFVNSPLRKEHGNDIIGKKCYSILQDLDSPCPFCTNDIIFGDKLGKTHVWEFQNNVTKRWHRCIDKAIEWTDGRMVRFEMAIDIHEHKMSEKALRESEERFEAISTFAQDAIIAIDSKYHITFWNKAAQRIFGYSHEEALDQKIDLLLSSQSYSELCEKSFSIFQEAGEGSAVGKTLDLAAKNKNGKEFPIELSLSAVMLKNKWTAVVVIRDTTERKRFEDALLQAKRAAENANRTKSEFLANMSHELRTPLNAIIGFSDAMLEGYTGNINKKQDRYLNNISGSGKHLLSIINDILDISKVESGNSLLKLEKISIWDTLKQAIAFMQPLADSSKIVLKLEIEPGFNYILADKEKFNQILYNLIGNAIKFTDVGGNVTIRAKSKEKMAYISVMDTGIGIEADDQEKLFKPFTQLDSSFSRQYEGTGLGLALTRELVELHKGKIWVESKPEKGSNFTFTIPLEKLENNVKNSDLN
ncbi:PAS domain S-box protein [Methanolobus sp. ZRKC2]|uniref:PAS domain-containing sensor histidine kinase n=1 Tax=Methanolobus sp. ZRKC2 TaxID=3125783 RepID=UPI003252F2BB